jgi:tRNA A37 methylthiotransferase MiaB
VILGFLGESDADFEATCRVVREVGFCKMHIFSYSPRAGTPAASMADAVPPALVAERRRRLLALERELADAYYRSLQGRVLDVLVEGADAQRPGWARGTSCRYAPVAFEGQAAALLRRRVPVQVVDVANGVILGKPVPEQGSEITGPPLAFVPGNDRSRLALPLVAATL